MTSWPDAILQNPSLSSADWRVLAAIATYGDISRDQIAQEVGITIWQVSRCLKHLALAKLLTRQRVHKSGKTRNTYQIAMCASAHNGIIHLPQTGLKSAHNGAKCASAHFMHEHDDDDNQLVKVVDNSVDKLLDFLDPSGRAKLATQAHVTPEFALAWRQHKQYKDLYNDWGKIKNPAGYIYREMERGNWPVVQQSLPEGILDIELLTRQPGDVDSLGRVFQEDGTWR